MVFEDIKFLAIIFPLTTASASVVRMDFIAIDAVGKTLTRPCLAML